MGDHDPQRLDQIIALADSWVRTGDPVAIDQAIALLRRAAQSLPALDLDRAAALLFMLGFALQQRFPRGEDARHLEETIDVYRQAVAVTPPGHRHWATVRSNLGAALLTCFKHRADVADLNDAVSAFRDALNGIQDDDPVRATLLANVAGGLFTRCEHSGDPSHLREAVAGYRHAVSGMPPGDSIAAFLADLGAELQTRVERGDDQAALEEVIAAHRDAVMRTPSDHPARAALLFTFGSALHTWSWRTDDIAVLEQAIAAYRDGVVSARPGHPDLARLKSNLGHVLARRYELSEDAATLEEAITAYREAERITAFRDAADPERGLLLSNLGHLLCKRFEARCDVATLDEEIAVYRHAVTATPIDHPERARRLSSLGGALSERFKHKGDTVALEEAVAVHRDAVAATPPDHPRRAAHLNNLGGALQAWARHHEDTAVLKEAVAFCREAVAATPPDHPDRAMHLHNLGIVLQTPIGRRIRAKHSGDVAAQTEAVEVFAQAARMPVASASVRCLAAQDWADLAASAGDWSGAAEGYALAVSLLVRLVSPGLTRVEQEDQLSKSAGLASDAAACALRRDGDAAAALALLEQGRGMLLAQTLNTRADLTDLRAHTPTLATQFEDLRAQLDEALSTSSTPTTASGDSVGVSTLHEYKSDRGPRLAREWEELLEQIRSIPGFDRFLLPPQLEHLTAAAAHGPVVTVNVNRYRSDALILTPSGVQVVHLPDLTPESEREHVATFLTALDLDLKDQGAIPEVLGWLWEVLAEPVLTALEITGSPPPDQPLPRVWWIPTGLLSLLPLHAAGRHADHSGETVMDRVVSSYIPTIRALQHARVTQPAAAGTPARPLIVAMAQTPGQPDLPGAGAEADLLAERLPEAQVVTGGDATRDNVLAALPSSDWTHFACHAASDIVRPSSGSLLLHDGPLSVLDIARLRLPNAALAYLSACSTAGASVRLADEAIHISSAFQLAGYAHVIATLWPIFDKIALDIADDIYTILTTASRQVSPAYAVHAAARRQRDKNDGHYPALWASHIHTGP